MNKRIISLSLGLLLLSGQMGLLASESQKPEAGQGQGVAQQGNDPYNNVHQYMINKDGIDKRLRNHFGVTDAQIKDYQWSQAPAGYKLQYYGTRAIKYTGVGLSVLSTGDLLWRMYKNPPQREALTERLMTSAIPLLMVSILGLYGF